MWGIGISNPIVKQRLRPSEVGFPFRWLATTLKPYCKTQITTLGGWIPILVLASYNPQILLQERDHGQLRLDSDPCTGSLRPSNPIVTKRLRPWEVGLRPLHWLRTTLKSYCNKRITTLGVWVTTLALARYDPHILL